MLQLLTNVFLGTTYIYTNNSTYRTSGFLGSSGFYIVMSLTLLVLGGWLLYTKAYKYSLLKKRCTIPVEARILDVDYKSGGRGGRRWNATYEFFFNEQRFVSNNEAYEQVGVSSRRPKEGDVLSIMINPLDPHEIYDYIANHGRTTGFVSGILIAVIGIILPFIPMLAP